MVTPDEQLTYMWVLNSGHFFSLKFRGRLICRTPYKQWYTV